MEKLSRRKVLISLAAAGAGAAVVGTANAQNSNLRAQEARLRNVLEHVEIANDRIKGVAASAGARKQLEPSLSERRRHNQDHAVVASVGGYTDKFRWAGTLEGRKIFLQW